MRRVMMACALAVLACSAPASAQNNMSLRGPAWAQPILAADLTPTTGGRAALADAGITTAVRITIVPQQGGVARVVRFEVRGAQTSMALRRFTGHPSGGWWIWGPDTPTVTHPTNAQRDEIATLVRGAIGLAATIGTSQQSGACASGEQAFVEMVSGDRSISATRSCVEASEPVGRLALRLSEIAGSRNEEELFHAAQAELLAMDVAFNAKAQADGVPAAFAEYAGDNATMFNGETPVTGHDAVVALFANWPATARLTWTPQIANVSERGDMGWTWGTSVYVAADGTRRAGRYVTTWGRDSEGRWKFTFDAALR